MIPKELQGIELNQYLWKNRIILTFANDEDHSDLIKLKVEMKEMGVWRVALCPLAGYPALCRFNFHFDFHDACAKLFD